MTYHWVCSKSNTTDASRGAGTACHSGAPVFVGFALLDLLGFLSKVLLIVVCPLFGHCFVCPSINGFEYPFGILMPF
jgi:hypothetical protein